MSYLVDLQGPGAVDLLTKMRLSTFYITGNAEYHGIPENYHAYYVKKVTPMSQTKIKLALSYTQQADILRKAGDLKPAIEAYKKATTIYLELSEEEPSILELVASTIEAAAVTYKEAGDFENAKETQAEAVKVREQMAKLEA